MRRPVYSLVVVVLATSVLASCGFINQFLGTGTTSTTTSGDGSGTVTISGTITVASGVTAPTGTNIIVGLLEYVPSFDQTTQILTPTWSSKVSGNPESKPFGSSVAYSFSNVPAGQYIVVAWADTTANGSDDKAEAGGSFPTGTGSSPASLYSFQSDNSSADITLSAPTPTSTTVTVSGTVTLGQGVTLPASGTLLVGIVDSIPDPRTNPTATWSTAVPNNPVHLTPAASVAYSISGVPKGNHVVFALVDANANGWYEPGELASIYPYPVSGPPTLKDFESDDPAANIALRNTVLLVASTAPGVNAAGVDESGTISVTFSDSVQSSSVSDTSVYLDYSFTTPNPVATTRSAHIPGHLSLSGDGKTVTFVPDGGSLAQNLTYTLHVTTGVTASGSGLTLASDYQAPFTTRQRVLGPAEVAALYNQSFEHGLASWTPDLQYAGTNVGAMTVSWANKDGTTSAAVLGRTGALSAGDWGAVFLGQDLGSNLSVAEPGGGTYVTVTVTIWRASTDNDIMNIPQAKILYGDQSSAPYASFAILNFSTLSAGTDPGWVTATTDQIRLAHTTGVLYVGKVEIGQTGTNFTTYVDSVSVNATAVPW